jgi:putative FmdB family regulatory protein
MPTYEYICKDCGDRFDHFQSMSSPPLKKHPECKKTGANVERVISGGTGLIFKGSGFYLTDYKNSDGKKPTERENTDSNKKKSSSNKTSNKKTGENTA